MSKRNFSNWLEAYGRYTERTEAPAHFHMWTGMFAIGATLARNVWIDMGAFDWVPNQYLVLVGSPGIVTKSTSIRLAEELVRSTERVKFGSNSSTWQSLAKEMQHATAGNLDLGTPTSAITLCVSELGSFLDLEDRGQVDFMVDIWDGQRGVWQRSTVGGGAVKIESPCLNLIAATTPIWIRENFKQSMVGGGLSSRMILVLGRAKRHLIAYPGLDGIGTLADMKPKLIEDLVRISELSGPMTLTPDAIEWGKNWYTSHILKPASRQLKGERFEGYYARKQTHMHKIAMILSASTSETMRITKRHLQAANGILLDMEKEYGEILENVQASTLYSANKMEISRVIRQYPNGVTEKDLYKEVSSFVSGYDFKRAVLDLLKADDIKQLIGPSSSSLIWNKYRTLGGADTPSDVQNDRTRLDDIA